MVASLGVADTLVQASAPTGQLLAATPETGSHAVLDAVQLQQALAGEVSFTGAVDGERSRILATTIATPQGPVMLIVGAETDVSAAAGRRLPVRARRRGRPRPVAPGHRQLARQRDPARPGRQHGRGHRIPSCGRD